MAEFNAAVDKTETSFRGARRFNRHSGAREARTRNLEIPGLVLRTIPE
jgi:hypothetical protein